MAALQNVDVTMTATRRPDLVAETLSSFRRNLFANLPVRRMFVNIDPVWGSEADAAAIEALCRSYFGEVEIRQPATPSFGAAVQWLWAQPKTEWFCHLEDDWLLCTSIKPSRLAREMAAPTLAQIRLVNYTRMRRLRRRAIVTTSPSFIRTSFANQASAMMNPALDPEKQFRHGLNPPLTALLAKHTVRHYGTPFTPELTIDIGRQWREARGISKGLVDGASVWTGDRDSRETGT